MADASPIYFPGARDPNFAGTVATVPAWKKWLNRLGWKNGGGGGVVASFPTGVSSDFAKAFYSARDATGFGPATWYDSNTFRIGVNQSTYTTSPAFGGPFTRCNGWRSLDGTKAMNFELAGHQGSDVSRNGALLVYGLRGKIGVSTVSEIITATLVTAASNTISWAGSVSGSWGTTTTLTAPAGAPFTANAANFGGGLGWVDGVTHVFRFDVDGSVEIDASGHPNEANRCYLPLEAGAIPAGGRFVATVAMKAASGYNTWLSRAGIMEPAQGGVFPSEYAVLSAASNNAFDSNARNAAHVGTSGAAVLTMPTSLAASEQRGAALYAMHLYVGSGVGADLSFVSGHYDRASHQTTRHEPISSVNPGLTTGSQKVYCWCDGWVTTFSANASAGPYQYEVTYGDGNPTAHQYKLWNDDIRANPTRYGSNVAAEWTGSAVAAIHHSVWNAMNNGRLQGQLTGSRLWWNYAQSGAMTPQIPQAYCRDVVRHIDPSKMGKLLVYIGEGVNDPPPTTSLAAGAAFMAQLPLAVIQYRSPDVTAAQMPVIFSSIMRPNIAAGQSGIGYDSFDGTFVQSLDAAMKAGGSQDLVAAGSANGYLNQQDNPVCDAAHNNGTYWQNPHLWDAGEVLLETFIATDANAR